jgi:hypothetical protein
MGGEYSRHESDKCILLAGKPERDRPLQRSRCRWEDIIRVDLRETGLEALHWINLDQDRGQWRASVHTAMKLRIPQNAGNFLFTE